MKESMISVLLVEPCKRPKVIKIENTLEKLQELVGGYIEVLYPFEDKVAVIVSEEGKINGLPLNRAVRNEENKIIDIIAGTFIVAEIDNNDVLVSLSNNLNTKYYKRFYQPERFIKSCWGYHCLPYIPKKSGDDENEEL